MSDPAAGADLVWKALADPTRRAILDRLRDGPRTTSDLADGVADRSRFAVMKHLGVLRDAGLVVVRPHGRERWHHLNGVPLREAYERWMAPLADRTSDALLRLREHVEPGSPAQPRRDGAPDRNHSIDQSGEPMSASLTVTTLDIQHEIRVAAAPDKVFQGLLETGSWWPHTFRDGSRVQLEPHVGGRFWEEWDGGGALYATVRALHPGSVLELEGPMGMAGPATSRIRLSVEADGEGSVVRCSHRAFGDVTDENRQGYQAGWVEVLDALRNHVGG